LDTKANIKLRIPDAADSVQVNFCKNPACPNFGVPAISTPIARGRGIKTKDNYIVTSGSGKNTIMLRCSLCGEYPTIKSNTAIHEELARIANYLTPSTDSITCPKEDCDNNSKALRNNPKSYQSFGQTKSGSHRYRCKLCKTTFAVGKATTGQKKPHKNLMVFRLLINKMPFRRICEAAGLGSMNALYWKIDFIHKQCLAFAADRERRLLEGMPIRRLYVGVDRQDYMVNWSNSNDRRNVMLHAVGSADNETGYVFGLHLNYDPMLDSFEIEKDAESNGDYSVKIPFRRHARLWLMKDSHDALRASANKKLRAETYGTLTEEIENVYDESQEREDIEVSEQQDSSTRLPLKGMKVHSEYTLYAHFFFLRELFAGAEKVRFFLDQDSGMRASCLSAFAEHVKKAQCDAFYVRINKGLTINEKRNVLSGIKRQWDEAKKQHPDLSDSKLKLFLIKERMNSVMHFGKWQDKWIYHPFPSMSEPEKAMCYLTDIQGYDEDHKAWLYNKASLHAIDRFFMQVRRRLSLLERPISTPSASGRRWYGYSAYNPAIIIKLLDIFRVFYNYVEAGKDGETPAMRLGLAKGEVSLEDINYYR
jgi:transposase-like protein